MNAPTNKHLITAVEWTKHSAAQWVEQYGAWVQSALELPDLGYPKPLARAIEQAKKKKPKNKPAPVVLNINDDEARAVGCVLRGMLASLDATVSKWGWVLILRYESAWEWPSISGSMHTTIHRVREMEKEALAYFWGCIVGRPE